MHTEEEAKEKFCPLTSLIFSTGEVEIITNKKPDCCIVAECMMWRWEEQGLWFDRLDIALIEAPEMSLRERQEMLPRKGYCGLGGKP